MSRPRIAPRLARPSGTKIVDPDTGRYFPGEFNQDGMPMGTPRPLVPSALDNFQAGRGTPNLARFQARQRGATPAPAVGQRTGIALPVPVGAPASPAAAPTVPQWRAPSGAALPRHPDDRALMTETRARDAAATPQSEARAIPLGDPAARAFWGKRSTPEPGTTPAAPRFAQPTPDPATLAAAGTGRTVTNPFGSGSSRNGRGDIPTDGFATSEGVFRNTQAEQVAKNTLASNPFRAAMRSAPPAAAPSAPAMGGASGALSGIGQPIPATPAPRLAAPLPGGVTDFPPPGMAGGRFGGTGSTGILGRPVLETAPRPFRSEAIPVASSSHPPTPESATVAASLRPAPAPFSQSWRWPFSREPAPDFPPADKQGGRFGGTGGVDAPLQWSRPKRKATPLMDKVAGGYGS